MKKIQIASLRVPFMVTAALSGVLVLGAPAWAQDQSASSASPPSRQNSGDTAASASSPAKDESGLTEIVVTAQRRQENLQVVPIAVAAFNAEVAKARGISDLVSLANAVPGLLFNQQVSNATPFLRGVGSPVGQIGNEPSVALYVDDVYIPAGIASFAGFNNIDRVEVLKGPQGTLFGRNATGGVVQVFTRNPTATPELEMQAGYANYDTISGSVYASAGLSEDLSASIAAYGSDQRKGWGTNLATKQDVFRGHNYGGRIKLLWKPADTTSVLLTVDHDSTTSQVGVALRGVKGQLAGVAGLRVYTYPAPAGFYDVDQDAGPSSATMKQTGVSLRIDHDLSWADLISISAYRHAKMKFRGQDDDLSPLPLFGVDIDSAEKSFTQEIRLQSNTSSDLRWMVGAYYFHDKAFFTPLRLYGGFFPNTIETSSVQTTNSYAGFGQVTATVLPNTNLTAGLRYTRDERSVRSFYSIIGVFSGVASNSPQSANFEKLTWRLALDHQLTQDVMIYAAYNRGFKSGTYNTITFPGSPIDPPVRPEVLDAYTAGIKSELLGRRLRFNVEGFWYDYKDIQLTSVVLGTTRFFNAAAARIKGVDVDIEAVPVDNLTLTFGLQVMDGKYRSFPSGLINVYDPVNGGNVTKAGDLSGNKTIQTPPVSYSGSISYVIPTERNGKFSLNASLSRVGDYYFNPDNGAGQSSRNIDRQPISYLVNLSLGWQSPDERWGVRFWGNNVLNEKYYAYLTDLPNGTAYSPSPPATYGVTFSARFGR